MAESQQKMNNLSKERSLDVDELESLLSHVTRSTVRQQLEQLISKLRCDAAAIKRAEESHEKATAQGAQTLSLATELMSNRDSEDDKMKKMIGDTMLK